MYYNQHSYNIHFINIMVFQVNIIKFNNYVI